MCSSALKPGCARISEQNFSRTVDWLGQTNFTVSLLTQCDFYVLFPLGLYKGMSCLKAGNLNGLCVWVTDAVTSLMLHTLENTSCETEYCWMFCRLQVVLI